MNTKREICRFCWPFALACAALLAGCSQTSSGPPSPGPAESPSPASTPEWEIVLTVSGGFAGLSQRFVARSPEGAFIAEDLRRDTSSTRMLSAAELDALGALLGHVGAAPVPGGAPQNAERGPSGSVCADCINYEITIRTRNALYDAIYDTTNLGGAADEPLIQRLVELGRQSLADPTTRNQ